MIKSERASERARAIEREEKGREKQGVKTERVRERERETQK